MAKNVPVIPWFTRRALIKRSVQIISTLSRHGLVMLLTGLNNDLARRRGKSVDPKKMLSHAQRLRFALTDLGAAFIKFGQALSARTDLLPAIYVEELSKLVDEVPPHPFDVIEKVIFKELGAQPEELFAVIDPDPIASASIGQVYAATLKNGVQVVIKVIRPGVEKQIEEDLEILADMAEWASNHTMIGKMYDLPMLVEEFSISLRNELDYEHEGKNADLFKLNFYNDPRIIIPHVYWELTTKRVITIERVYGIKINELEELDRAGISRKVVAENLMHMALRQLFEFGVYQADPHSGNFFVQPDGALAVIDFGMVGRITNHMKKSLINIVIALQREEPELLVDELLASGFLSQGIRRKSLSRDIGRFMELFSKGSLKDLSAMQLNKAIMGLALRYNLQLPNELVLIARAIAISEGTGMMLYPGLRLVEYAGPYVRNSWLAEQSIENILPRMRQAAVDGIELGVELPRRLTRLLDQLERGQLELSINMERIQELLPILQRMTNRLSVSILLAGTIVALGLVMVVYQPQQWQRLGEIIFAFALVVSIFFGLWLVWSMIRGR